MESVIKEEPIIPAEEVKSIFSIIEIISKINGEFLQHLEQRMRKWNVVDTNLGDTIANLVKKINFLALLIYLFIRLKS
jgi:hypothetical protein